MIRLRPVLLGNLFLLGFYCSAGVSAGDINALLAVADSDKGEKLSAICLACHSIGKGESARIGPNLYGIVGRKIASEATFNYSQAMAAQQGNWDFDKLDAFLTDPAKMIPATAMAFPGIRNETDRAAILAWLRLQSDHPVPLPSVTQEQKTKVLAASESATEDPDFALLPPGDGREEVFYSCSVCHSIKLVVQQGLDRAAWEETLAWMVEEQAMQPLDAGKEKLVLDYLSRHFGINR